MEKKRIVVVGGGTGTYTVLTGLKRYIDTIDVTAIVAMTDSGGSTGRLRDESGYLPVGDVRMALAALAKEDTEYDDLIRKLFLHRFATQGDVGGHNFGNLFLVALTDILGSEEKAIEAASTVLRVCGRVLPVTNHKVNLVATYKSGRVVVGEHEIDEPEEAHIHDEIISLSVTPQAELLPDAREAIRCADLIIFGPGDLYTSILANAVVHGFGEALKSSKGKMVYVSNLMTKIGQTLGMSGVDAHVREITRYTTREPDYVVANDAPLPDDLLQKYKEAGEYPIQIDVDCTQESPKIICGDILAQEEVVKKRGDVLRRSLIRHDPHKLAKVFMNILSDE